MTSPSKSSLLRKVYSRGKIVYAAYAPGPDKNDPVRYSQHVLAYCRRRLALPANVTIDIASLVDPSAGLERAAWVQ